MWHCRGVVLTEFLVSLVLKIDDFVINSFGAIDHIHKTNKNESSALFCQLSKESIHLCKLNYEWAKTSHMVFEIFIIRPNRSNTSSNILLYSFLVQNNTSNIKIWFCVRYLRFLYFAVFIGHPTRGEADSGRPKAIDKSPSAGRCRPCSTLRFLPSIAIDGRRQRVVA